MRTDALEVTFGEPTEATVDVHFEVLQRPSGLAVGDVWRTRWTATLSKHDIVVEDNDQYMFWVRLMPHVQISPTREVFASVRQDID